MLNQNLLLTGDDGYNLSKSLRLRSSASAYLNRTFSTPTNANKFTLSIWAKRGKLGSAQTIFNVSSTDYIQFNASDNIQIVIGNSICLTTSAVYRDPSAWYHFVFSFDNSASPKWNFYVNNVNGGTGTLGSATFNTAVAHYLANIVSGGGYLDGYMTEVNFIDGQTLTPSSFGSTNALTGVWQPKKFSGTYGTNGFYLPFTNTASTTALGYDFSGNSNNWTTNNFSISSNSTYDSMKDVPTLTSATTANYCVINSTTTQPVGWGAATTFSNANLTGTMPNAGTDAPAYGTIALPRSGKWYWEVAISSSTVPGAVGVSESSMKRPDGTGPLCRTLYSGGGTGVSKAYDGTNLTGSYTYFSNATLGVACDMDNGKLFFSVNGTYVNSGDPVAGTGAVFTDLLSVSPGGGSWLPVSFGYNGHVHNHNYGQQPFSYTPPTGFVALNTYNLPTSTIVKGNTVMDATTYTGNGTTILSTQTISNGNFKPDFIWIKSRSTADYHNLNDSVRGIVSTGSPNLFSNTTGAEATFTGYGVSAVTSTGFTLIGNGSYTNTNGVPYVGWQWQANQGVTSSNTNGTITSTVSANPAAGFSVFTFNSGSSGTQTVGHGLGVYPGMIIFKDRTGGYWNVWHSAFANPAQGYMYLDLTNAVGNDASQWSNTAPTSSVFTYNSGYAWTANHNMVAYAWAPVAGYSAFGSYTGNGSSDGPFVYTGFRPKFVLMKATSGSNNWIMYDTVRNTYNLTNLSLVPDSSAAENGVSGTTENTLDILSNGFKLRTSNALNNGSSVPYIYMAFAENPFKNALAR